jgi:hydrogenase-4 component B
MEFLITALFILTVSGIGLKFLGNRDNVFISVLKIVTPLASCALAFIPLFDSLVNLHTISAVLPWKVFGGPVRLELDPLSAVFLLPVLVLSACAAVYGRRYLQAHKNAYDRGTVWCSFNLLVASMILLVTAGNAVLFLIAWEGMSLASFFLVIAEKEKDEARKAGWIYLCVTHLGTAFLVVFFFILGNSRGSLDFADFTLNSDPVLAGVCFLLAVIGFGSKAGIIPLHIWLPEAHPAAPSHVSALMSGVMLKMGIYGLVRSLAILGAPPAWWGITLIIVGAVSGLFGVLFALAQHDMKRLLAYHSVENIGIILIGIGLGLYGVATGSVFIAAAGFAGGLLHMVNHAFFKGLLFLGAGSVISATGIRDIDRLGGLIKKLPVTAVAFLIGSIAISGIPPLNGFISEFLIYSGAFGGLAAFTSWGALPFIAGIISLAAIGGLALACFTKVFGIVFLGGPRSKSLSAVRESPVSMLGPMLVLAFLCVFLGIGSLAVIPHIVSPVSAVSGLTSTQVESSLSLISGPLWYVTLAAAGLPLLFGLITLGKKILCGHKKTRLGITWDCGYEKPSFKMQYTGSSFAQPITDLFRPVLRTKKRLEPVSGHFPRGTKIHTATLDVLMEHVYRPLYAFFKRILSPLLRIQHGRIHIYILYILCALVVLLLWKVE